MATETDELIKQCAYYILSRQSTRASLDKPQVFLGRSSVICYLLTNMGDMLWGLSQSHWKYICGCKVISNNWTKSLSVCTFLYALSDVISSLYWHAKSRGRANKKVIKTDLPHWWCDNAGLGSRSTGRGLGGWVGGITFHCEDYNFRLFLKDDRQLLSLETTHMLGRQNKKTLLLSISRVMTHTHTLQSPKDQVNIEKSAWEQFATTWLFL